MSATEEHIERKIKSDMPAYLSDAFQSAAERALKLSNEGYRPYPGNRLAPISKQSAESIALSKNIGSYTPYLNESYKNINRAGQFFPQRRQEYLAPYQQAVVQNIPINMERTYREGFLPELESRFSRQGQFGRPRHQNLRHELNQDLQRERLETSKKSRWQEGINSLCRALMLTG